MLLLARAVPDQESASLPDVKEEEETLLLNWLDLTWSSFNKQTIKDNSNTS
jgi:hypothetical protein